MATPDQFIVDNTSEDWKALQYVREWCDISSAIDIATGHFEVGAFLALDGAWQKVDKIRLLIGGRRAARLPMRSPPRSTRRSWSSVKPATLSSPASKR